MPSQTFNLLNDSLWTPQVNFKPKKPVITHTRMSTSYIPMSNDNGVSAASIQSGDY